MKRQAIFQQRGAITANALGAGHGGAFAPQPGDARYFSLASRIAAEMGAQFVKTYYVAEGFEKVTASCPVPIVIAGGKKLPEQEALEMCFRAIDQGASGVDMGRNIFQSVAPLAMLKAVKKVVHENISAREAYQFWQEEKQGEAK
jgi:putative autoinducer-2 (AI-2) aldolase